MDNPIINKKKGIDNNKRGVALFIVLATLFVVLILGNVILNIVSSQARLTHHQVSRIQAYYAAQAGMNYAFESLRTGSWLPPGAGGSNTYYLCNGCTTPPNINEPDLPHSVSNVTIVVADRNAPGCVPPAAGIPVCIKATATYTYP